MLLKHPCDPVPAHVLGHGHYTRYNFLATAPSMRMLASLAATFTSQATWLLADGSRATANTPRARSGPEHRLRHQHLALHPLLKPGHEKVLAIQRESYQ